VLAGVGDLLLAAHLPLAHGRQDLELGIERRDRAVDAHLVVSLAGAAVGDRVAARCPGPLDRVPGDQRPGQGREQRIASAIERVRLDRREHVVLGELLGGVDSDRFDGAEVTGLAEHDLPVLARLADVDGEGDDLGAVTLLDPVDHHRGVEAARIEQQYAADGLGIGLIGGDSGRLVGGHEGRKSRTRRGLGLRAGSGRSIG
jgi:hypothetical protein